MDLSKRLGILPLPEKILEDIIGEGDDGDYNVDSKEVKTLKILQLASQSLGKSIVQSNF